MSCVWIVIVHQNCSSGPSNTSDLVSHISMSPGLQLRLYIDIAVGVLQALSFAGNSFIAILFYRWVVLSDL